LRNIKRVSEAGSPMGANITRKKKFITLLIELQAIWMCLLMGLYG